MPVVPVKDIKIQPQENDIIVGSYGRGAFICDVSLLHQLNDTIYDYDAWLFDVESKPQRNYSEMAYWGNYEFWGDNSLYTANEPNGLEIYTWLKMEPKGIPSIEIINNENVAVDTLHLDQAAGLQKIIWDSYEATPGTYKIKLINGDLIQEKEAVVKTSPQWSVGHSNLPYRRR